MKRIFVLIIFLTVSLINLNFAHSISPDVFIQSTVNRASQVLSENISKEEKIDKLKLIAKETVDIKGVGYYSLGSARKNLNSEEISIIQVYLRIIS
jgi:phospholipid transport system substrate-binding protein